MGLKKLKKLGLIGLLTLGIVNSTEPQANYEIRYMPNVVNTMIHLYEGRTRELPICLFGTRQGNRFTVNELRIPRIYTSDGLSSTFEPTDCHRNGYLGIAHTHINNPLSVPDSVRCNPSEVDIRRFINDNAQIESIICYIDFPDRINIHTIFKELIPDSIQSIYRQ